MPFSEDLALHNINSLVSLSFDVHVIAAEHLRVMQE